MKKISNLLKEKSIKTATITNIDKLKMKITLICEPRQGACAFDENMVNSLGDDLQFGLFNQTWICYDSKLTESRKNGQLVQTLEIYFHFDIGNFQSKLIKALNNLTLDKFDKIIIKFGK